MHQRDAAAAGGGVAPAAPLAAAPAKAPAPTAASSAVWRRPAAVVSYLFFGYSLVFFKLSFPQLLHFLKILDIFLLLTGLYLQVDKDTKNNIFCLSFLHFYIYV